MHCFYRLTSYNTLMPKVVDREPKADNSALVMLVIAGVAILAFHQELADLLASHGIETSGSPHPGTQYADNGVPVGWLWSSYSTEGTAAFHFHHPQLSDPPHGNTPNGLDSIKIETFNPNHPHVFGNPTITPEQFLKWSEHAGKNGEASPIYTQHVAMEVYYKLYLDGVDPRAWAAITMAEDHGGTDPGWYAAGTGNFINELYKSTITNNHPPGFFDHTSHGYHYMSFARYGNESTTVGAAYASALFAVYYDKGINNPAVLERVLSGGSISAEHNTSYWLSHLTDK